ncbi:hypothetical protein M408DRAFT_22252 [Serendipita vermifera MAFF 305830]|uniref:C2H2-type domain-containing protein n=1 Tax=Serendipita vermifera MAFF 305830 TaxID=933852 RepID=A0A0C3BFK0_SERVB|nr:hypothetical protein M408DRAFT_22252 [Serendipita vermifera MAFF 305830]
MNSYTHQNEYLPLQYATGFYPPPDQPMPHSGYGTTGVEILYNPAVFVKTFQGDFSSSIRPQPPTPADNSKLGPQRTRKPRPHPERSTKEHPIAIETLRIEHSPAHTRLIENLPSTLRRIIESWSGDTSATQSAVLERMLNELDDDSRRTIDSIAYTSVPFQASALVRLLDALCGPTGKLCLVVRNGSQSGVSSITCNKCKASFTRNAVQAYAHHMITEHWKMKVFACFAAKCGRSFAWTQDRDRHEKTKHNAYRKKAYDSVVKQQPEPEIPQALSQPQQVYQALQGYNMLEDKWEY